jgi:hypothetical protein
MVKKYEFTESRSRLTAAVLPTWGYDWALLSWASATPEKRMVMRSGHGYCALWRVSNYLSNNRDRHQRTPADIHGRCYTGQAKEEWW